MWREIAETALDWFFMVFLAMLALTWFVGLFLVAWTPEAKADVVFESMNRQNAGWRWWSRQGASTFPVAVCKHVSYDVLAGEKIKVDGFAQVNAEGDLVGQNVQIAYCDDNEPSCRYTGRWDAPSIHMWDAGNVGGWIKIPNSDLKVAGEHHKIGHPFALYVSPHYQASVEFQVFVNTYAKEPRWVTVDDCGMLIERHRP